MAEKAHPSFESAEHLEGKESMGSKSSNVDEALAIYSAAEEKQVMRKLDWNLIPMLGVLYLLSFLDRGNIGNAYTAGLGKDWNITSNQYSWVITAYYLSYICFQWFILVWKLVPLRIWIAGVAFGWGVCSILQASTKNFAGLIVLRVFIGIFEAGFAPGVALFLSFFYKRSEMGLRYGLFISFSPIANCFASAMAYGIVQAKTSIQGWQLLFIIEGIPTLFVAGICYFFLPQGPGQCPFLNERENEVIRLRAIKGRGDDQNSGLDFKQVAAAFTDYKNYMQAIIIFCLNSAFAALPAFLPTIIKDIGFSSIEAQGLSAPPYLVAYIVCISMSFASDRFKKRGFFIIGLSCTGAAGYLILALCKTEGVRYFATYLVCAGVFAAVALTFTWVTDNQGSSSKTGAGLVIFGMIGQTGSIAGSRFFPKEEGPYYVKGMSISCGLLFFAAVMTGLLSLSMKLQNRRKDEKFGNVGREDVPEGIANVGDSHPQFRYIL